MRSKFLLAAMLVVGYTSLFATTPAPPVDAKTQLAIELMQISHYDRNMQAMQAQIGSMLEKQYDSFASCDAALPTIHEFSAAVGDKLTAVIGSEEMKIDIASIYAEVFSEDELREVIAFYQSPLGKKLLDRMPALMQKSMQISQDRIKTIMPELQQLGEQYGERIKDSAAQCKASATENPTTGK